MSTPLPSDIRADGPATLGLLLNFAALLAITGSLAMALSGQTATAVVLAIAAAVGFVTSLVYFAVDSHRADQSAD